MLRHIILFFFGGLLIFSSCRDKIICPAYQSAYILDDSVRYAYFSYAWQLNEEERLKFIENRRDLSKKKANNTPPLSETTDTTFTLASSGASSDSSLLAENSSLPVYFVAASEYNVPWRDTKKNSYGLVKRPVHPIIKEYRMKTAPKEDVKTPVLPILDMDSTSVLDTLLLADSTQVHTNKDSTISEDKDEEEKLVYLYGYDPKDNFNVEQEYYNKYLGELLIDRRANLQKPVAPSSEDKPEASKQSFFKRIFSFFKKKENIDEGETDETERSKEDLSEEKKQKKVKDKKEKKTQEKKKTESADDEKETSENNEE